jgi:hypothetical protein
MCEFCNGVRGDGCVVCGSGDVGFELRTDGEWDMRPPLSPVAVLPPEMEEHGMHHGLVRRSCWYWDARLPFAEEVGTVAVESIATDVAYAVKQLQRLRHFHSLFAIVDAGQRALDALERVESRLLGAV